MHSEMYSGVGQSVHHRKNIPHYFKDHIETSQFLMLQRFEPILFLGGLGLGLFAMISVATNEEHSQFPVPMPWHNSKNS